MSIQEARYLPSREAFHGSHSLKKPEAAILKKNHVCNLFTRLYGVKQLLARLPLLLYREGYDHGLQSQHFVHYHVNRNIAYLRDDGPRKGVQEIVQCISQSQPYRHIQMRGRLSAFSYLLWS